MPIAVITFEDFEPLIGEDFVLPGDDDAPPMVFKLIEAKLGKEQMSGAARIPFSLTFRVATQDLYPQGMYRLTHPAFEYQDIFLVPVGQSGDGTDYNAYYN